MVQEPVIELKRLADQDEIPPGQCREFIVAGRAIAVFNVDGSFHAIDSVCPHKKGPLAEGPLEGRIVTCPWHGWEFDVTTGQLLHDEKIRITCYRLQIEGNDILIEMPQG